MLQRSPVVSPEGDHCEGVRAFMEIISYGHQLQASLQRAERKRTCHGKCAEALLPFGCKLSLSSGTRDSSGAQSQQVEQKGGEEEEEEKEKGLRCGHSHRRKNISRCPRSDAGSAELTGPRVCSCPSVFPAAGHHGHEFLFFLQSSAPVALHPNT
ncbi:hypothetical protein EYF80_049264 [Liparis tanakae]|uniref:Uncharacterized protein n=1 Tax=Liparis tanakae TaxID=230148 RepID=A0A4Z2FH66_9TELE|nr:hypothetical protein EYF80_049264 [Liparis tanakae]